MLVKQSVNLGLTSAFRSFAAFVDLTSHWLCQIKLD